jgi:tRNA dimethylallyltransferase
VVGPTASGKTALSLALAERLDAEIISVDSRQVYRGMDIGTAKVSPEERVRVPHHGLDLIDPDQTYSAGRFAREAREWIQGIRSRGRVPLLVGGTGFFLRALVSPIFREPALDAGRRTALRAWLAGRSVDALGRWVRVLDPERSELALQGGAQRVHRTLEVALLSGRPLSWWHRNAGPEGEPLEGLTFVLDLEREELNRRIDARVERMLAGGLVEEVKALIASGYSPSDPGLTATGYREVVRYLSGEWSLEEAAAELSRATRAYARRQQTWFRTQLPSDAVRLDATASLESQVEEVSRRWSN